LRSITLIVLVILTTITLFGYFSASSSYSVAVSISPTGTYFDHVVIILMENEGYCNIITTCGGAGPYETFLASTYSLAGKCTRDSTCSIGGYTALSHPSEPNYCAMISGAIYSDCNNDGKCCFQDTHLNLVDRLQAAGLSWQAYAENARNSGKCSFRPPNSSHYPFLYFKDNKVSTRCSNFLTATNSAGVDGAFLANLNKTSGWANFIWLTPNDKNNGHNTGAAYGDRWLSQIVPKILGSYMFTHSRSALFITYDEGKSNYPHDFLYSSWSGPIVDKAYIGTLSYDHYSILKTLETNWGFSALTSNDGSANAMTEFIS
jgi:phosphatidylinositol-3-phosphatase